MSQTGKKIIEKKSKKENQTEFKLATGFELNENLDSEDLAIYNRLLDLKAQRNLTIKNSNVTSIVIPAISNNQNQLLNEQFKSTKRLQAEQQQNKSKVTDQLAKNFSQIQSQINIAPFEQISDNENTGLNNEMNKNQFKQEVKRKESNQKQGQKSFSFLGPPQIPYRVSLGEKQKKQKSIFHSHAFSMDKDGIDQNSGKMFPLINTNNFFIEQPQQDVKDQFQRIELDAIPKNSSNKIYNSQDFSLNLLKNFKQKNQSHIQFENTQQKKLIKKYTKQDLNQVQTKLIVGSEDISPLRSWTGSRNNLHQTNIHTQPNQRSEIESIQVMNSQQKEQQNNYEMPQPNAINLNISKITGNESVQSSAFINLGGLFSQNKQQLNFHEPQDELTNEFKKASEFVNQNINHSGLISPSEQSNFTKQQQNLIEHMRNQSLNGQVFHENTNNNYYQQFQEQKKLRLLMQSKVYSQDLSKESEQINKFYQKDKSIKQKSKQKDNLLKKNIEMIQLYKKQDDQGNKQNNNNDLNLMASQKLDRLKKLQEKTSQFIKEKQLQETESYFNKIQDKYKDQKKSLKKTKKENELKYKEEKTNFESRKNQMQKSILNESVQYIIASPMHFDKASESQIEQISVIQPDRDHHQNNPQEIIGVSIKSQYANFYINKSQQKIDQIKDENEKINEQVIQKNDSQNLQIPQEDKTKSEQKTIKKNIQSTKNLKSRESRKASGARSKDMFTNATETGIDSQNNLTQRSLKQKRSVTRRPFSSGIQQSKFIQRQRSNQNDIRKYKIEYSKFIGNIQIPDIDQINTNPPDQTLQNMVAFKKEKIQNKERGVSANTSKINISKKSQNVSQIKEMYPMPSASLLSLPKINENRHLICFNVQKEDEGISILEKAALYDANGQLAYTGKHRKPKWVWPEELDRFNRFEDPRFALENKGNNNIRIENPFVRQPYNNKVFDHISAYEVGKYLEGVSYLEKLQMSNQQFFNCQEELLDFCIIRNEIRQSYGIKKSALTEQLNNNLIVDFQIELKRDTEKEQLSENLKSKKYFLTDFRNDSTHKEFTKCIRRNRLPTDICKFQKRTNQQQVQQLQFVHYDPVDTEKRRKIYGSVVNQSFIKRQEEMKRWDLMFQKRSDFDNLQTELGQPVIDQVNKTLSQYHVFKQDKFPSEKQEVKQIEISIEQIFEELDVLQKQSLYLNTKFENLQKPSDETIARKNQMRFNFNSFQNKAQNLDIQQRIENEFGLFADSLKKYNLFENSCYQLQSDQSDYQQRKLFEKNTIISVDWDTQKIVNDDIYKQKQLNKSLSRLTQIDLEVINEKGILVPFRSQVPHYQIYDQILIQNFTFQQQNQFYFQWYANILKNNSYNKKSEFDGFYKIKRIHESMLSRQNEVYYKKLKFLNQNYFDYKHLQNLIYNPQWRDIYNSQEKLIQDKQAFEVKLNSFLQFFPQNQKSQQKKNLKTKKENNQIDKFLFKINENFQYDDQTGKNNFSQVLRQYDNVFRQKYSFPSEKDQMAIYESFEVSFPISQDFHDKKYIHAALQNIQNKHLLIIKESMQKAFEKQIQQVSQNNKEQKVSDEQQITAKIKKSKSYLPVEEFVEENEIKKIYEQAELFLNFPYTTDIFTPYIEHFEIQQRNNVNRVAIIEYNKNEDFNFKIIEQFKNKIDNQKILVNEYSQEVEIQRADTQDCIFLKWIETSLGDQKYENLFLNQQKQFSIPLFENIHYSKLFQNLQSAYDIEKLKMEIKSSKKIGGNQGFLLTLNKVIQNQIQDDKQSQIDILMQYLPKHISQLDAPQQIQHLNIVKLNDPYILNLSVELPRFIQNDEIDGKESHNQNQMKSKQKGYSEYKFKPKLNHSEQVEEYVQKQLRKEIMEAVENGDIVLLKNFSQKFGNCLEERSEMHCNYQSKHTGDTILHVALLMNYDTKKSIVLNKIQEDQQAGEKSSQPVQTSRSIGKLVMNPFKKLLNTQSYSKALSKESDHSLQIKESIVQILVKSMDANPNLQNLNGLSPYEIAKNLKQPDKIMKIFNEKVQT